MRTETELRNIKNFIDSTYNRLGNLLLVDCESQYNPLDPESPLGYCFKHVDPVTKNVIYKITCSKIGIPRTDFRIMMHEYGHIYLTHMDGIYEELDSQICNVFKTDRGELIERINSECGIDFADKLIERVIDDPVLNHSLHNIAMDMEVNSSVLSKDDIEEMEMDITDVMPKYEEELIKLCMDQTEDPERKKQLEDTLKKMESEAKIKLVVPERYNLGLDDSGQPIPFPNDLDYPGYLILIVKHLDQFVKMLVSIKMGGNGDTSQISQRDIQNALQNMNRNWANKSEEYKQGYNDALNDSKNGTPGKQENKPQQGQGQKGQEQQDSTGSESGDQQGQSNNQSSSGSESGNQSGSGSSSNSQQGQSSQAQQDYQEGYNDALNDIANSQNQSQGQGQGMQSLSDLMSSMGMTSNSDSKDSSESSSNSNGDHPYKGIRPENISQDHRTDSRDEADRKRELGEIKASGGVGCGSGGSSYATRLVDKDVDEVDMALQEVMQHIKSRVIKTDTKKDVMKLYNKGIVRSVIAPSISRKVTISSQPKIVYLIDISGSMDTRLVDRILKSIAKNMKRLSRGLRYDIITWSTCMGEHIKDIDPKKPVPRISMGGGTRLSGGIKYFKDNYKDDAVLIVISDFEDYLEEWVQIEKTMPNYVMYGFNYGSGEYGNETDNLGWTNMKIRNFNSR